MEKPIDSGPDIPMEVGQAPQSEGTCRLGGGSKEHMLCFLLSGDTKNLNLSHAAGDGCHPCSGCFPPCFIELEPSVC